MIKLYIYIISNKNNYQLKLGAKIDREQNKRVKLNKHSK